MARKKQYRFFYHLNKPETKKRGEIVWTVHWKNQCLWANHIVCNCKTWTREQTKRQPYAVVVGDAETVEIDSEGTAVIT